MKIFRIIAIKFKNAYYLVFKNPVDNQLRIQDLNDHSAYEGSETLLSFKSYSALKHYQKKVRLFTVGIVAGLILATVGLISILVMLIRLLVIVFNGYKL